jgi:hypothetical protein
MPEDKSGEQAKTIEMRLAAIEDKLSKMHVTEEEMRAYQKVASLMGTGADPTMGAAAAPQLSPIFNPIGRTRYVCWPPTIVPRVFCYECVCGPCACGQGGGGFGGGGFGGLGM